MLQLFNKGPDGTEPVAGNAFYLSVEAWKHENDIALTPYNFRQKALPGAQVTAWINREGAFATPKVPDTVGRTEGCIRILFAQQEFTYSRAVPPELSDEFLNKLHLPPSTMVSLTRGAGVFSVHCKPEGTSLNDCEHLAIILKTPQKREVTNGGIAISHDFTKGLTSALIFGRGYAIDMIDNSAKASNLSVFTEALTDCRDKLAHPFLLPCLFLLDHIRRVQPFITNSVTRQVIEIEERIGVTSAGRTRIPKLDFPDQPDIAALSSKLYIGEQLQRHQAKVLTERINDLSTSMIFIRRSPLWDGQAVDFLVRLLAEDRMKVYKSFSRRTFEEPLEFAKNYSEASLDTIESHQARMQLQLNILYTSVAQDDSQTSARMAISAGKDSTSMKILAIITAFFLPGTFVATLFSMSMFNWQASTGPGQSTVGVVSHRFWMYWAVAIPLTVLTLIGWASWWFFEMKRFDAAVALSMAAKPRTLLDKENHSSPEPDAESGRRHRFF